MPFVFVFLDVLVASTIVGKPEGWKCMTGLVSDGKTFGMVGGGGGFDVWHSFSLSYFRLGLIGYWVPAGCWWAASIDCDKTCARFFVS